MRPYTLVTGASAGLGVKFAEALAREGRPLVIAARRSDRLEALAQDLRARFGIAVLPLAMDLSHADAPETLFARLEADGIAVDTLINNAGFGARGLFADIALQKQEEMVDLNCRTLMALCHRVLPAMIARGDGAILNVASVAGFLPGPYMSTYYATKAFVLSLSQALHEEVKAQGVRVSALCPGPTNTEFAAVAGLSNSKLFQLNVADSASVVQAGLAAVRRNNARRMAMRLQKGRG